jgi:GAF domain-containing protein
LNDFEELHKSNQILNRLVEEQQRITKTYIEQLQKKQMLDKLRIVLQSKDTFAEEAAPLICNILDSDVVLVHLNKPDLWPVIAYSKTQDAVEPCKTQSSTAALNLKEVVTIADMKNDPAWLTSSLQHLDSSLSVPMITDEGEAFGVLEVLRKSKPYDSATQLLGQQVASYIQPSLLTHFLNHDEVVLSTPLTEISPKDQIIQLAMLLNSLRTSVGRVVPCETCCIYFIDQLANTALTQKSEFSDCLEVNLEADTVLGYTYKSRRTLLMPQDKTPTLKDSGLYSNCSVVCVPVHSVVRSEVVQGLIIMTRTENFNQVEVRALSRVAEHLACLLDQSYSDALPMLKLLSNAANLNRDDPGFASFTRSNSTQVSLLSNLTGLVDVTPKRIIDLKPVLLSLGSEQFYPLKQLSQNLRRIIPCQHSKLFLIDDSQSNLFDVLTESLVKISGLSKMAILSKHSVVVNGSASRRPNFDRYCDSLGLEQMTESFLCVPVLDFFNSVIGVMTFVNSPVYFSEEDIKLAEFVALIPRELSKLDDNQLANWTSLVKAERKHKNLQHWFKQVTIVSSSSNQKATFAKDILLALNTNPDAKTLFKYALLVVRAITNAEEASVIYRTNEVFTEFNKDGNFMTCRTPDHLVKDVMDSNQILTLEANPDAGSDFANMLLIPLRYNDRTTGILKAVNKKDESTSLLSVFTRQDEKMLMELSGFMGEAVLALSQDKEVNLEKLYEKVREIATSLNTYTLLSVIRTAAQNLLNCDRGTVFTREGEFLVVKAQALEQEVPLNYRVPVGSGIVGCVVQTGATEIIADVYQDPRFNNEMDLRTGYRTRSVLCMPVKDTEGKVIAALQMINKRNGSFTPEDAELLDLFTEQVGSVLQSTSLFNKTLEESCQLYNILSSLGSNILVIDQQGRLIFSNKPIESLFGVAERLAKRSHFAVWLRDNTTLVQDITQVLEHPTRKIERQSQKLVTTQLMRSGTLSSLEVLRQSKAQTKTFNYVIQGLANLFSKKNVGAVLIFEDATEFEALRSKFADMEIKIKDLTSPVQMETNLQKCLKQLTKLAQSVSSQGEKDSIQEVIDSLRAGNLHSPQIVSGGLDSLNADLRALRDFMTAEYLDTSSVSSSSKASMPHHSSEVGMHLELTELRDWNLNVFEIENFNPLIISMLDDFDLFGHLGLNRGTFITFTEEIHSLCEIRKNPFHNFMHCFTVMHSVYMLLVSTPAKACFSPTDILALLVAALVHDVDHTGRGNAFEINKGSHLALLYHDKSVLEQHHAAVAFLTMQRSDCNIFESIDPEVRKRMRLLMIAAILDTDMAAHFRILPELKARFEALTESPFGSRDNDTKTFGGFLLHCSDLGHPAKDFTLCSRWSQLVCQEFSAQNREEVELGLPVTEFMKDLHKPIVYYKNEINFLTFVILPLWKCAQGWLGSSVAHCVDNIEANMKIMQLKLAEETAKESRTDS